MKSKTKRLSALLLSLAMCVSFVQIPAFAEEAHSGDVAARSVSITSDGSFTITKRCDTHKDSVGASCTETTTGKIGTKIENGNIKLDPTKNILPEDGMSVDATITDVTCVKPATIIYKVTIGNKVWTSDQFVTAQATNVHDFSEVPAVKSAADAAADTAHYSFVSDTATCQAAGKVTYAKICKSCGKPIATETVEFDSAQKVHAAKMKLDQNGKETNEVDVEKEFRKATTCGTAGEYYEVTKCKYCDAVMTRSELKTEAATGLHNYVYTVNWTKDSVKGNEDLTSADVKIEGKCSVCGEKHTLSAKEIKVTLVTDKTVAPISACQPGSKTYTLTYSAKAPVANKLDATKEVKTEVTVPYYAAGSNEHQWSTPAPDEDSVVEATCTAAGKYNLVKTCTVCGEKEAVATVKIPKIAHKAAAAVKENVVNATYAKAGSYDLVTRCADCGKVLSTSHKTIAKLTVKAPTLSSVKNVKGKKATVSWKKASGVSGTQVQYSTSKSFKSAKSVKTTASSKTISKLSKNKKYYVRVRSYKVSGGKTYYSSWSKVKTVTIKK